MNQWSWSNNRSAEGVSAAHAGSVLGLRTKAVRRTIGNFNRMVSRLPLPAKCRCGFAANRSASSERRLAPKARLLGGPETSSFYFFGNGWPPRGEYFARAASRGATAPGAPVPPKRMSFAVIFLP